MSNSTDNQQKPIKNIDLDSEDWMRYESEQASAMKMLTRVFWYSIAAILAICAGAWIYR